MITMSLVTPISYSKVENLQITEYILLYLDKGNKLKRAIPDFSENIVSYDDSLIMEAMKAERVAPFKYVCFDEHVESPVFNIQINENGEVFKHSNMGENTTQLENFLLDSNKRRNVARLLKKLR